MEAGIKVKPFSYFVILCASLLLLASASPVLAQHQVETLTAFDRLYVDHTDPDNPYQGYDAIPPPSNLSGWQQVELKDYWNLRRRVRHQEGWYRSTFNLTEAVEEEFSIYIPRHSAVVSVWINGIEIGNTGNYNEPVPRNWNHPVLFAIPAALLNPGNNDLEIHLKVLPSEMGYLFEVSIGPTALIKPIHGRSYFAKVTATKILTAIIVLSAIVTLTFYFSTQLPKSYLWFAIGCLLWSVYSLELFVREIIVPTRWWLLLTSTALWLAFFCYLNCLRDIFHSRTHITQAIILILTAGGAVFTLTLPDLLLGVFAGIYLTLAICTVYYFSIVLVLFGFRSQEASRPWLIFTGAIIGFLISYDVIMGLFSITADFGKYPYIPLVVVVSGGSFFIVRMIRMTKENETFSSRTEAALSSAIEQERQRLMREIHDGVGGQLLSTLAHLEKDQAADRDVVEALKNSVADLRLIVHSLESMSQQGDIVTILATIRERMEKSLNQQGIRVDWRVTPVPAIENFSSDNALHFMRIVQEAITNIVRHANARLIQITTQLQQKNGHDLIVVIIKDDGHGFAADTETGVGLGVRNMRERANKLDAELQVQSGNSGTEVVLRLPLRPPRLEQ